MSWQHNMTSFLVFAFLFPCFNFAQSPKCYRKDGSVLPDVPCDPEAKVSACCGQGWTCSNSMYCTASDGFHAVGSCTDITWQDSACPFVEMSLLRLRVSSNFSFHANFISRLGFKSFRLLSKHHGLRRRDNLPQPPKPNVLLQASRCQSDILSQFEYCIGTNNRSNDILPQPSTNSIIHYLCLLKFSTEHSLESLVECFINLLFYLDFDLSFTHNLKCLSNIIYEDC